MTETNFKMTLVNCSSCNVSISSYGPTKRNNDLHNAYL